MTDDNFVKLVQQRLKDRGQYKGAIDGVAGPVTLTAFNIALPDPDPQIGYQAPK